MDDLAKLEYARCVGTNDRVDRSLGDRFIQLSGPSCFGPNATSGSHWDRWCAYAGVVKFTGQFRVFAPSLGRMVVCGLLAWEVEGYGIGPGRGRLPAACGALPAAHVRVAAHWAYRGGVVITIAVIIDLRSTVVGDTETYGTIMDGRNILIENVIPTTDTKHSEI